MNIGDESQVCASCEELEWQCQCPPAPDEVVNPTPDDYYDAPTYVPIAPYEITGEGVAESEELFGPVSEDDGVASPAPDEDEYDDEPEGLGFEDSMSLKYPLKDYDAGYDHYDQGW